MEPGHLPSPSLVNCPPRSERVLTYVFVILFLDILGLTILSPVLPYIVRQYSSRALAITLMTVTYSAAQFLAAPLLGHLSDRIGRRPVLLGSIFGSALGYLLFGIGGALWVLLLSRLIDGFTGGNVSTAIASIADITPPPSRTRNFGLVGLAFGLGFVLGPALGGALSRFGLAAPAFAAGGLSLFSAVVGVFILPETLPYDRRAMPRSASLNPLATLGDFLRRPAVRPFLLARGAFLLAFTGVNSVLPVFLIETFHARPGEIAGLFVVAGLGTALVQSGLASRLVPRYGERRLTQAGLLLQVLCALAYLGLSALPIRWLLYPISGLGGASSALIFVTLDVLVANHASEREQGKAAGVNAALTSLMTASGPLLAGVLYDRIAMLAPFGSGIICLAMAYGILGARGTPIHSLSGQKE